MLLVTGGTGFIGSHLLQKLSSCGRPARALVRPKPKTTAAPRALPAGTEVAYGDLKTGEGLDRALRGVTGIIHLAGVTKTIRRDDYYSGNLHATERLVEAISGSGVRLVHVSTLAAVGPSPTGVLIGEDAEPHPITHYGRSKLEAEIVVRKLAPEAVIVRPPVVYGPRDTDVFQMLRSISRGLVVEISGGERWFSAIYVEDLVDGLLAALDCPAAAGRTYFLAHPKAVSWSELAAAAARIMKVRPRVVKAPVGLAYAVGYGAEIWSRITGKPGIISREKIAEARCMHWTCDTVRAASELGFLAPTMIDNGLERTLAWYKEAGWLNY